MGMATTATTPKTVDTVDTSATLSRYVARVNHKFIFSRTGFHSYVCRRLDELEQGRCNRLILTCPPQHGKSTLVAEEFVSWHLGRHPDHRVVLASYSQTRSIRHGRASRERLRDPGFQAVFPACKLWEGGSAAAASWQTTEGGGCISVGTGGSLTGETADLMVIDDPVANAEEANSPTMRENVWDWFLSTAMTRLSEKGVVAIIMCMTGDTPILMADGTERQLREIKPGDRVATYDGGKLRSSTVKNHRSNGKDSVFRIRTTSGKVVRANERHPFLVEEHGELKWIRLQNLTTDHKIVTVRGSGENGLENCASFQDVQSLQNVGDTARRITERRSGQTDIGHRLTTQSQGEVFVSSLDTGSRVRNTMRWSKLREADAQSVTNFQGKTSEHIGEESCASIIATKQTEFVRCCATIATLQSHTQKLKQQPLPWPGTCDFTSEKIESIVPDGIEEVFDVQVEGTENFIANGLVVHNTRWHLDDLVGRLLVNQPGVWRHINFKAIAGPGDLLGRKSGEALFPEIKSAKFVTEQRNNLTRYWASALYDGEPVPRGGHLLDANTLRIVQPHDVPDGLRWVRGWDPAAVDKATSKSGDPDFTAGAKCALDHQGNFWVADVTKWQLGWPKSRDRIKSIAVSENIPLFFEAQAAFKAAADNLCEVMPPNITVRTVDVSKDKVSRCNEWFALAEHGKVRLVAGPWVAGFLQAVEQFDGSGSYHDDEIDAVSIGYEGCSQSWWNAFAGQGEAGPSRFAGAWANRANRTADV